MGEGSDTGGGWESVGYPDGAVAAGVSAEPPGRKISGEFYTQPQSGSGM
ncbi:hypothetical protein [Mobiluncus mulieris]|nr:hypothetical protein [Mobiluncus mulieris]